MTTASDPMAQLLKLLSVLHADREVPESERAERDRRIADELDPASDDETCLQIWLMRVSPSSAQAPASPLMAAGTLVVAGGTLLGMLSVATAFYYDGSGRVNVLAALGLLLGVPTLMLMLSWLSCLSLTRARLWPFLGDLIGGLAQLSPGRLTAWLAPRMSRAHQAHLRLLFGADEQAQDPALGPVRTWFFARWSHLAGIGFFTGALISLGALVVFTDLVFGWSTTLTMSSARFHQIVSTLAEPWRWAWPAALPDLALVDASQYFRAAQAVRNEEALARLGQWWPFLLMMLGVYGWLPRLLSAALAGYMLRRHARAALTGLGASRNLLDRLRPVVTGVATEPEPERAAHTPDYVRGAPAPAPVSQSAGQPLVVNWSETPISDERLHAFFGASGVKHAGGTRSLDEDAQVVAQAAESGVASIVIVCKAWEPPMLDLHDFAADLVAACDAGVKVMPVAVASGNASAAAERDRGIWSRSFEVPGTELAWLPDDPAP